MKRLIAITALALLTACGTGAPPTATPLDQEALCARGIVEARKASTALLRANHMSVAKHKEIDDNLTASEPGCRLIGAAK